MIFAYEIFDKSTRFLVFSIRCLSFTIMSMVLTESTERKKAKPQVAKPNQASKSHQRFFLYYIRNALSFCMCLPYPFQCSLHFNKYFKYAIICYCRHPLLPLLSKTFRRKKSSFLFVSFIKEFALLVKITMSCFYQTYSRLLYTFTFSLLFFFNDLFLLFSTPRI